MEQQSLIVESLNTGDVFTEKGIRLKVFSAEDIKVKGGGRGMACLLAEIDNFVDPKNPNIHPLQQGLYPIMEDGRINLGSATNYVPKKV